MTVIVRNPEGRILVMCKGADSIILPLLHKEAANVQKTVKMLEGYSKEGLRTLLIAEKEISEDDYNMWNGKYQQALIATSNREEKVAEVSEEIETDFYLIGSTAIEDKLQDDVADTIEFLKDAGIKVWVLTGDKIETAINIGVSCKLLS
jgi:magnesium-transporting ATPase (P-type)